MVAKYYIKMITKPGRMELFPDHKYQVWSIINGMHMLEGKFRTREEAEDKLGYLKFIQEKG